MPRIVLAFALLALVAVGPAAAECTPGVGDPEATLPAGDRTLYLDTDPCQPGCVWSVWVYEETNGIDGLQRGDRLVDHTCDGLYRPDTWLAQTFLANPL